ncbi:THUMP domain-containing protein 1-like [Papilio machaon]|uniref:THUMP domain-containing protein 1-like n=1 Tax=Papilio machaon TaxID=76193 RepID=A0A194R181_PAPMA|nr:THUMP domain-containing protein 1 homolog [Papilio machaon]KPJ11462.1 THUMP domain-containing protein 1-like [Papilio machaon]
MGDNRKKKKFYFRKRRNKYFLEPGFRGFFCTCNFREKDCVKEMYNLLNEYAGKIYPDLESDQVPPSAANEENSLSESEEETDIGDLLKREVDSMKKSSQKSLKHKRFQVVETGASNCIFIKTNLPSPEVLTTAIIQDLSTTKVQKTRHVLRLLPIMATCKANLPDIMEAAGKLFDKYFLKNSSTFAVIFNKRFNSSVCRDLIIKELADLIVLKNGNNKADLKNPSLCIIVEIIKGICLLSVVDNYFLYKKYNLHELGKDESNNDSEATQAKKFKSDDENVK